MGEPLQPFSLAHYVALQLISSPYLLKSSRASLADLGIAVFLCRLPAMQALSLIASGDVLADMVKEFAKRAGRFNKAEHDRIFRDYIADFTDLPDYWIKENENSDAAIRAPAEFHIIRVLCKVYNCKLNEAWATPMSLARLYFDVEQECLGSKALKTPDEDDKLQQLGVA
jgi:hypothetical protein